MRKRIIFLLITIILLTGCSIKKANYGSVKTIIDNVLYKEKKITNKNYEGYNVYIPQGLSVVGKSDNNIKIKDNNRNIYYLYVDTIAYHYKTINTIELNDLDYYVLELTNGKKLGYIDIKEENGKYFIVIMYNYSKIEAYVEKEDLNETLVNACNILSSIKYNDIIIDTYVANKKNITQEETFDIFSSKKENDSFLTYEKEYGTYKEDITSEDTIKIKTDND